MLVGRQHFLISDGVIFFISSETKKHKLLKSIRSLLKVHANFRLIDSEILVEDVMT